MLAPDIFARIPSATALLVLASITNNIHPVAGHAVPRQTKTLAYRTLHVLPWPLEAPEPTAVPGSGLHDDVTSPLLLNRQFNTVCGYIGGDPDLPATCSAGSHCAVDVEHNAIGCCPDGAACTAGVYTGCVDGNSDPQNAIDPYVYTCGGGDSCYKNHFDGGYFQYGCGSKTGMGATVAASASGKDALSLTELSLKLTATKTTLSEPTTLGTKTKKTSETTDSSTTDKSSTTKESTTTEESSTTTDQSSTTDSTSTATADPQPQAPDGNDNASNTGAIVGGTIGGVAFIALAAILGLYLWRKKKGNARSGPGPNTETKYISPNSDPHNPFAPLPSVQEEAEEQDHRPTSERAYGSADISSESYHYADEPISAVSPYSSSSSSRRGHHRDVSGVSGASRTVVPEPDDQMPLTSDIGKMHMDDNIGTAYSGAGYSRASDESAIIPQDHYGEYPGPRRGRSGSALWQQNREQTRNLTWL